MSHKQTDESVDTLHSAAPRREAPAEDPLADTSQLIAWAIPSGVDRRSFLMRTAVGGAAAVMTGCSSSPEDVSALRRSATSAGTMQRCRRPRAAARQRSASRRRWLPR